MTQERVAVVAVHGIGPAQRYDIQDQVAENLRERLPGTWSKEPFFPPFAPDQNLGGGSALRLRSSDPDAAQFDIFEGYWSPIDKNETTVLSVFGWLARALFAPLNATTPLPATGKKLAYDLAYVGVAILLVFALPLLAVGVFATAYASIDIDERSGHEVLLTIAQVFNIGRSAALGSVDWRYVCFMLLSAAGWYVIAQVLFAWLLSRRPKAPQGLRWQHVMRIAALLVGAGLVACAWLMPELLGTPPLHFEPLLLLIVAMLVRLAYALAIDFFVNRMGDIQIYTTADYNDRHYELREDILNKVEAVIYEVLHARGDDDRPYYDRIYILGHSLGSTIAMDALIRLRQSVEAGRLGADAWQRIKAFVTFGTALEKTRFFFSARNPTFSETFQHWRDDAYGSLFSNDPAVLANGHGSDHRIFWANYWYFRDVVANRIVTYRCETADACYEDACFNVRLREHGAFLRNPWVHGDYLGDDAFWKGIDYDGTPAPGVSAIVMLDGVSAAAAVTHAVTGANGEHRERGPDGTADDARLVTSNPAPHQRRDIG